MFSVTVSWGLVEDNLRETGRKICQLVSTYGHLAVGQAIAARGKLGFIPTLPGYYPQAFPHDKYANFNLLEQWLSSVSTPLTISTTRKDYRK